jgi:arylsulfatase A-like enzyme
MPDWITPEILEEHRGRPGPHTAQDNNMYDARPMPQYPRFVPDVTDMDALKRLFDGYDCGIAYMDQHIGMLFRALEEKGVMDDLMIIISADHGENFGELGIYSEHATADRATCRIPMIIRGPGIKQGHVDTGLHYNLDLPPTLAELLDQPRHQNWDGQSYLPALQDGTECGRDELILSQCAHVCQRSVRWDHWLYLRTLHDGFHLWPREMLFNLEEDPHEQHDLAGERPDLCAEGARRLMGWQDDMMASMPFGYDADPLWTTMREGGPFHARGVLAAYCTRLEETGRGESVPELKKKFPEEFK